jgi:hypothetical protein
MARLRPRQKTHLALPLHHRFHFAFSVIRVSGLWRTRFIQ